MDLDPDTRHARMVALEVLLRECMIDLRDGNIRGCGNRLEGAHRVVANALKAKESGAEP